MTITSKNLTLKINGMHCAACEVLVERKLRKVKGVEEVKADHVTQEAEITCSQEPKLEELNRAVNEHGYTVSLLHGVSADAGAESIKKNYAEIGAAVLVVVGAYLILKQFNLIPQGLSLNSQMSYGFVFLIGLVAAVSSCLAVTGGLLLAVAAKYNERHPDLSGFQKFKPTLYFNVGRIAGYTVLGALTGALGSLIALSPRVNGVITIIASLVMIILGFQLLHLFPRLKRFQPRMPKIFAHKIHDWSGRDHTAAPFVLGALTFFLPCGFTQALQLYVLSTGDAARGGLIMLVFSLGTLPALLSLSALSSFMKGAFQRYFLKFAGVVVIMLGLFNIRSGLTLSGANINIASWFSSSPQAVADSNVRMENGVQIAEMKVTGLEYYPHRFTVQAGVPVEWRIEGQGAQGCGRVITVPRLKITKMLLGGRTTIIRFTPQEAGTLDFSCSMGMTTPGSKFVVVDNSPQPSLMLREGGDGIPPLKVRGGDDGGVMRCDPTIANCL